MSEGVGGYGGGFTAVGAILVLFILLVIISKAISFPLLISSSLARSFVRQDSTVAIQNYYKRVYMDIGERAGEV